ncbi:MAG: DUF4097 family beta strand repeat protein [Myxococcales bacterium]|nr:DUF4097 family beta strand repeat protein [Myxococcales bacterium]
MPKPTLSLSLLVLFASGCFLPEPRTVDTRELSLDASALDTLRIDVGAGDLDVVGDPTIDAIEVRVCLRTNSGIDASDDRAREALDARLETDGSDGVLYVHIADGPDGYYADVTVALPSSLRVAARDGSGDIRLRAVAALDLVDDSGDVDIEDVAGPVTVDDESGDLRIVTAGPVSVVDTSGDLTIEDVGGDVVIEDDSGEIVVDGVDGDVDVTDGSGGIVVRHVTGRVTVRDGSGDIEVTDVGDFELLEDGSGSVRS